MSPIERAANAIFLGGLVLMVAYAVLEWWRNRDL